MKSRPRPVNSWEESPKKNGIYHVISHCGKRVYGFVDSKEKGPEWIWFEKPGNGSLSQMTVCPKCEPFQWIDDEVQAGPLCSDEEIKKWIKDWPAYRPKWERQ